MFTRGTTHRRVRQSGAVARPSGVGMGSRPPRSRSGRASRRAALEHSAAIVWLGLGAGCLNVLGDVEVTDGSDIHQVVTSLDGTPGSCRTGAPDAGPCKMADCQPGERRCTSALLETCNVLGKGWELTDQCASAALCDEIEGRCQPPVCEPQEYKCTESGELVVCNADRSGFNPVAQCVSGAFCSSVRGQERCETTACNAGDQRCNGPQIERCRDDRRGYDPMLPACASASLCRTDGPGRAHCESAACMAGQFSCDGRELLRCTDESSGWLVMARCASPSLCNAATQRCQPAACEAGQQRCSGSILERCNADQTAYARVADCGAPALCDARVTACLTSPVTPPQEPPPPGVTGNDPYTFVDAPEVTALGLRLDDLLVPEQWTDVNTSAWTDAAGAALGPRLVISSDAARFAANFDIPGVSFAATARAPLDARARLDEIDLSSRCTRDASGSYEDPLYVGTRQNWINCGTTGARTVVLATVPKEGTPFVIVVITSELGQRDERARENVWDSFVVTPVP